MKSSSRYSEAFLILEAAFDNIKMPIFRVKIQTVHDRGTNTCRLS